MADPELLPSASSTPTVSPFELLSVLWRRRLVVVVVLVISVLVAVALSLRSPKQYSASAQLLFRDPGFAQALFGNGLFQSGGQEEPQRTIQTNIDVVTSLNVAAEARTLLNLHEESSSLLESVTVTPGANANVATIKATRSTPREAVLVANAFANGYIDYRRETDRATVSQGEELVRQSLHSAAPADQPRFENSLRQLQLLRALQTGNAEVIAYAQSDSTPVSPKPKRDGLLGLVVGLLLGCGLALLIDRLDLRLKAVEDIERAYPDFPLIASIPRITTNAAATSLLAGPSGEAYRMLREGLRFVDPSGSARCFVVTSADESEGKSTVAVNLASTLAAVGQRVLLVEADMRRPAAVIQLGVPNKLPGLSDLLISSDSFEDHVVRVEEQPGLLVLPSGTVPPNPSDLLSGTRMAEITTNMRKAVDVVVVDSPPLLPVADTRVLLQIPAIDGVILVTRIGTSRRDRARTTLRVLEQSGRRVFGLVAVGVEGSSAGGYYYDAQDSDVPRWGKGRARSALQPASHR